ncbi:MAG: fumarylacetoacetate hydrolase family protein [Burkholderiaceae bacterium]
MSFTSPEFDFAPWRLSGVVYGTLLNDAAALAALGDAVNAAPYKAPPRAPVLYLKPRNTLASSGAAVTVPAGGALEVGAALGIVIGRTACRVPAVQASQVIAGYVLVADLCLPHESFYRPSVRLRARDASCVFGARVVSAAALPQPEALPITVSVDGRAVHTAREVSWRRGVAQLLHEVTDFMTLATGDVLLLGVAAGAPRAQAGQRFAIEAPGFERIEGQVVAEAVAA